MASRVVPVAGRNVQHLLLLLVVVSGTGVASLNYDPSWRDVQFSGQTWYVKDSGQAYWGPGPNRFSPSFENIWLDAQGLLHMRITRRNGAWLAAELITKDSLGYGRYEWQLANTYPNTTWDANVVLGLFTWSNRPEYSHREIDVEMAKWRDPNRNTNSQFVVQPYSRANHLKRFGPASLSGVTHSFTWRPDRVDFLSRWPSPYGDVANTTFTFVNGSGSIVPVPGDENARINLWLTPNGTAGTYSGSEVEVVFSQFTFTPLSTLDGAPTSAGTAAASSSSGSVGQSTAKANSKGSALPGNTPTAPSQGMATSSATTLTHSLAVQLLATVAGMAVQHLLAKLVAGQGKNGVCQ